MRGSGCEPGIAAICFLAGFVMQAGQAAAQASTDHWLGWYAGGVLGMSWTDVDIVAPPAKSSSTYEGFLGGGVIGNNAWVTDRHLVGLEADLVLNDVMGGITMSRHRLSLLGRIGRFRSPSTLFFAVAGLAGGQYKAKVTTTTVTFDEELEIATATTTNTKRNKRLWGLTVGAGFERQGMLAGREIRWGMEYRFTDFQEWNFSAGGQTFSIDPQVHDFRFRIVVPFQSFPVTVP